jgi:hypothetical protein
MRSRARVLVVVSSLGLALGVAGGATYAAFSATTSNGSNSFSTAPDWTPPTTTGSVIARSGSVLGGGLVAGSAYFVYANVTDAGNPAAGVASVTANVSAITTGTTAAPLTSGGPWTIDGTSYAFRSASLTADGSLSVGTKTYTLFMADAASPANTATSPGFSVAIVTTPAASDIATTNAATAGKPDPNDTISFAYTTAMAPTSIKSGWDGTATSVDVRITNNGCANGSDQLVVALTGTSTPVSLGSVCLGANYTNGNGQTRTFASSTMVMSGATVTVTLGSAPGGLATVNGSTTFVWSPSTSATDVYGNPCSAASVSRTGAHF